MSLFIKNIPNFNYIFINTLYKFGFEDLFVEMIDSKVDDYFLSKNNQLI